MSDNPKPYSRLRSQEFFSRASTRLPLGVSSVPRYWGETGTLYASHGRGGRIWDIDGNEYIDYRLGYGATILGHCDARVDEAARRGMEKGGVFGLSTEAEYWVAQRINEMVPAAELVCFCTSGTAAVTLALRLARAYTGKNGFIVLEGGFHGAFDEGLRDTDLEEWDGTGEPDHGPYGEGIPSVLEDLVWQVPINHAERLEDILRKHGNEIGALLMEPIQGNACAISAQPQYIQEIRQLCTRYDVLLIADEIKTGFRVARGGGQELFNFQADLCTLGKSMANGYPLAALGGREEIMRWIGDRVFHAGTYNGHCIPLAAAEMTLEILSSTDALDQVHQYDARLRAEISGILRREDIPHVFTGRPGLSGLFFSAEQPTSYRDWKYSDYLLYHLLAEELCSRGVMVEPDSLEPWYLCAAHDDACLQLTVASFEQALEAALKSRKKARDASFCPDYFRKHIPDGVKD